MKQCSRWASGELVVTALGVLVALLVSLLARLTSLNAQVLELAGLAIFGVGLIATMVFACYRVARNIVGLWRTRGDQKTRPADGGAVKR